MINIKFDNINDLFSFLNNTKEFQDWEVLNFRISAVSSTELSINTKINDPMGIRQFADYKSIESILTNYYEQNSYSTFNFEMRMKFPNSLAKNIDPTNQYSAFYINFYCDSSLNYINLSFLENTIKYFELIPMQSWADYITDLYNAWHVKYKGD